MKQILLLVLLAGFALPLTGQDAPKRQQERTEKAEFLPNLKPKQRRALAALREEITDRLAGLRESGQLSAASPQLAELRAYELKAIESILTPEQVATYRRLRDERKRPGRVN